MNKLPIVKDDIFVTVDAGANLGWALWYQRNLVRCGLHHYGRPLSNELWSLGQHRRLVVVEVPQYEKGDSPQKVNDCIKCAVRGAEFAGRLSPDKVEYVWPHTWKHSVPKNIHNARVLNAITHNETLVLTQANVAASLVNNTIDAIGLGLVLLGRLR